MIDFICVFQGDNSNELDCSTDVKDFVSYQSRSGFYYQKQGKYKQAVEHFKKSLEKNFSDPDLHIGVAYNSLKSEDYKTAVEEYDKAFQLSTKSKEMFIKDYEEAVRGLSEITAKQGKIS